MTAAVRAIVTDLDGTLLTPDGVIHPRDLAALEAAQAMGIDVLVATGRPTRMLRVLEPIGEIAPIVVASNGACLFDLTTRVTTQRMAIDVDTTGALIDDLAAAFPGAHFGLERGDIFGCETGARSKFAKAPDTLHAPAHELLQIMGPPLKLLVYHDDITSEQLYQQSLAIVGGRATPTHSLTHGKFGLLEMSATGVTKEATLERYFAALGITSDEVIAFGDMPNDEGMLAWAGRGFVMSNGHPDMVARFEVVASNADAGVGRTIEMLLDQA